MRAFILLLAPAHHGIGGKCPPLARHIVVSPLLSHGPISDGPGLDVEAGGAKCAQRTAHMPGRCDQQPAIARSWLDEERRVDRVLMGVARRGFDFDPPSVDIRSEPLQRGPSLCTTHDHPQVRVLACQTPSLANALIGSAKRDHAYEFVGLVDLPLCASAHGAAPLAMSGNAPEEGSMEGSNERDWYQLVAWSALQQRAREEFAHSPKPHRVGGQECGTHPRMPD